MEHPKNSTNRLSLLAGRKKVRVTTHTHTHTPSQMETPVNAGDNIPESTSLFWVSQRGPLPLFSAAEKEKERAGQRQTERERHRDRERESVNTPTLGSQCVKDIKEA